MKSFDESGIIGPSTGARLPAHDDVRVLAYEPALVGAGSRFVGTSPVAPGPDWKLSLGAGDKVNRQSRREIPGASVHLATVHIRERMSYVHAVPHHVLYATLNGRTCSSTGQIGQREVIDLPDRTGAISFTPAGWERRGDIGVGAMRCAHIELGAELISEIIGAERCALDWSAPFNTTEPKLFVMIAALIAEASSPEPFPFLADTLLFAVARRATIRFGGLAGRADDGWLAPAALRRVLDRMDDRTPAPSLPDLASEVGLGVSAFVRAFRGTTGRTPAAFALDRRLDLAEQLVRTTRISLSSIATSAGFASASHLVAAFRQRRGITPGTLR